jgi:hypothetical protein
LERLSMLFHVYSSRNRGFPCLFSHQNTFTATQQTTTRRNLIINHHCFSIFAIFYPISSFFMRGFSQFSSLFCNVNITQSSPAWEWQKTERVKLSKPTMMIFKNYLKKLCLIAWSFFLPAIWKHKSKDIFNSFCDNWSWRKFSPQKVKRILNNKCFNHF